MEIIRQFSISGRLVDVAPLKKGHIHDTFVSTWEASGGTLRYLHQRINENVFRDIPVLMRNVELITNHLRSQMQREDSGERCLELVPARSGALYLRDEHGHPWRTYRYVEGTFSYELCPEPGKAFVTGQAFGNFLHRFSGFDARQLTDSIPRFQDTAWRLEQFETAIAENRAGRLSGARAEVDECLKRRELASLFADNISTGAIALRVTHGDPKINNLLFDEQTSKPVCVVDLDTCMQGVALYDFGDMVRTGAATAPEDSPEPEQMQLDMQLFSSLAQGFADGLGPSLKLQERELLPKAPRVLAWCQAIRFLADFLNGDTYYKVERPQHNLDRTRTQLALLRSMERLEAEMEDSVAG